MSAGGEAFLQFLGVTGDVDTSTPEKLADWILHLASRCGLLLAWQICEQHPTAAIHGSLDADRIVMNFYTRHYYISIACELLGRKSEEDFCRAALALIEGSVRLERGQRARELHTELSELGAEWAKTLPEIAAKVHADAENENARDFAIFQRCSLYSPEPGDTPHGRIANAVVGMFYAPKKRQSAGESIFLLALRSSIWFMKFAFGEARPAE